MLLALMFAFMRL